MKQDELSGFNEKGPNPNEFKDLGHFRVVRGAGLEPAQYCYRQDLNLVRLPISPPAQKIQTG